MSNLPPIFLCMPQTDFKVQKLEFNNYSLIKSLDDFNRAIICVEIAKEDSPSYKITINALLDTGASFSCIAWKHANNFGFNKVSDKEHFFYGNKPISGEYEFSIKLGGIEKTPPLKFGLFDTMGHNIGMLIGTDILSNFIFEYNNPEGMFTLKSK